mgnify:CR=1 FL=1
MKPSRSEFLDIRGLRYHLRCWGPDTAPPLVILHGWMDVSNSFQFVVDALQSEWRVIAPDLRGFGLTEWAPDTYWFPEYYADLEAILDTLTPDAAVNLAGHSMGSQVASMYAGIRPERISKLIVLDGLNVPDMPPELAPKRLRKWLDQIKEPQSHKDYDDFEALAERIRKHHAGLSPERALQVARGWGQRNQAGRVELVGDPKHRIHGPSLYRLAEAEAVWKEVTAPALCIDGATSPMFKMLGEEEVSRRRATFRDSRTVVIPDCGHMVHFDAPETVAATMEQFLLDT